MKVLLQQPEGVLFLQALRTLPVNLDLSSHPLNWLGIVRLVSRLHCYLSIWSRISACPLVCATVCIYLRKSTSTSALVSETTCVAAEYQAEV